MEVPRLQFDELHGHKATESSDVVRERVMKARNVQWQRQGKTNAEMTASETQVFCQLDETGENLLRRVFDRQYLSARGHDRVLRVARTIADMDGSDSILPRHLAEVLQFRALDQKLI